jgi:hypothetical protein
MEQWAHIVRVKNAFRAVSFPLHHGAVIMFARQYDGSIAHADCEADLCALAINQTVSPSTRGYQWFFRF